jgi:glutathione S-transferase
MGEVALSPPGAELWYLPGSPYSLRARWALAVCNVELKSRKYLPFVDQPRLWAALGFPLRDALVLTVPAVTLPDAPPLRHGIDIARYAWTLAGGRNAARPEAAGLFPPPDSDGDRRLRMLCEQGDVIGAYCRAYKVAALSRDPARVTRLWVPKPLQGRWYSQYIGRLAIFLFRSKHRGPPQAAAKRALGCVRDALATSPTGFLLGGETPSYADISLAPVLSFAVPAGVSAWVRGVEDDALCEQYPDLVAWRARVFSHFPGDEASAYTFES